MKTIWHHDNAITIEGGSSPSSCSEFWILDPESPGESSPHPPLRSMSAVGPFRSIKAAEAYLREDGADTYMGADGSLRELENGDHWAAPVKIVELRRTVRQVPVVSVKVRLETISPNEQGQARSEATLPAPTCYRLADSTETDEPY